MIKGIVLKDKSADGVINVLEEGCCINYGCPKVGFYTDKAGEFKNYEIKEFTKKLGLKVEYGPAFSTWLSGINESGRVHQDREEITNLTHNTRGER